MRIAFLLALPPNSSGAAWARIQHLALFLSNKGHDVQIISAIGRRRAEAPDLASRVAIKPLLFSIESDYAPIRCVNALLSFVFSPLAILLSSPDILVVSVGPGEPAIGAIMLSKALKRRVIFDYRDRWEDSLVAKSRCWMSKLFFRCLKKLMTLLYLGRSVVTVTQPLVEHLRERGIQDLSLVPNGADTKVFRPRKKGNVRESLGLSNSDFIIVYSGYIGDVYRLDVVLKALALFIRRSAKDDAKLILLGNGSDLKRVLRLANSLGLAKNVDYLGDEQARHRVAQITGCADVGIIPLDDNPIMNDSYPVKMFEYCACGLPIIATVHEDSILAGLIEKHGIGIIVPPLDVEALVLAIKRMYFDKEFREQAGRTARIVIQQHFDRDAMVADFVRLVQ